MWTNLAILLKICILKVYCGWHKKSYQNKKTVCGDFWFLPDHLVSMVCTGSQGDHIYSVNIKRDTGKHVT